MKMHTHRMSRTRTLPFRGPVSADQDPRAHGNITVEETCRCGAQRLVNRNQQYVEKGEWEPVRQESYYD